MRYVNHLVFAVLVTNLSGCLSGPGFLKQEGNANLVNGTKPVSATVLSAENGAVTGAVSGNSGDTQLLAADGSSAIAGASVAFPPGSLAIDTQVTIEEGASLATGETATELGIGSELSAASSAVVVSASDDINATQPFTVALTVSGTALRLIQEDRSRLVVVFKVKKAGEGYFTGVIPNALLTFEGNTVKFETMNFGSFQAVYTDAVITEKKEVVAAAPIVTKRDELALPDVQGLKVGRVTPASVELLWANGGGNTAGYVVAFALDASPTSCKDFKNKISDLAKQDLTISGLAAGKLYGFRVCAVDSSGRMSAGATVSRETLPATLELGSFAPLGTLPFDGSGRLRIGHNFSLPLQPSTNAQGYLATFTKNSDCAFPLKPSIQVPATPPAGSNLSGPLVQIDTLGVPDGLMFLCIHAVRDTKKRPMDGGALPVEVERTKLTLVGGGPTSNSMMLVEYSSGHDASGTIVEDATPAPVSVASPIMRLAQKKSGQVGVYYQATNSSGTSPKLILPIAAGSNPTSLYASPVGGTNYGFAGSLAAHDDNFISRFSKYNISPNTGLIIEKTASETPLAISGAQNVLGISTAVGSNGVRYSAVKEQMSTGVRAFFGGATLAEIPPASWEIDSGSNAHSIALALDANNAPHVVMKVTKPDTPNADCAIKYGRIVSANWTFQDIMTLDGSVSDVCANLSEPDIAVDKATGTIHIAVRNGSNFLHHKSIPGATPSSTTIGTSPTGSYFGNLFLRLDQFGIPYVITPILINAVEDVFAVADLNTGAWRWRVPTVLDGDDTTANPAEVTEFYLQDVLINGAPGRSYFSP